MSVTNQSPSISYAGNGTKTTYEFPYPILAEENLVVSLYDTSTNLIEELSLGTDYTVTVDDNEYPAQNGSITLTNAVPTGANLTILRSVPYEQLSVYPDNTLLNPNQIESDLDNLEMQIQQVNELAGRALIMPEGTSVDSDEYLNELWQNFNDTKTYRDETKTYHDNTVNIANTFTTTVSDAIDYVNETRDEAVSTVTTTRDEAVSTVTTTRDEAVSTVTTTRDEAVADIIDYRDEIESWAQNVGLWQLDSQTGDIMPTDSSIYTDDPNWEFDTNGDLMPKGVSA